MQTPIPLQNLDRTIFELIRLRLVANDCIPDITTFTGTAEQINAAYQAAKEAMMGNGKIAIELFGTSAPAIRDTKTQEKIVIDRKNIGLSTRAMQGLYIVESGPTYTEKRTVDSNTINYEIRVIATTIAAERLAWKVMSEALGTGLINVKSLNDNAVFEGEWFSINLQSVVNVTTLHDVMEYVYSYSCPDVLLLEDTVIQENIVPLIQIGVDISTKIETPQNSDFQILITE